MSSTRCYFPAAFFRDTDEILYFPFLPISGRDTTLALLASRLCYLQIRQQIKVLDDTSYRNVSFTSAALPVVLSWRSAIFGPLRTIHAWYKFNFVYVYTQSRYLVFFPPNVNTFESISAHRGTRNPGKVYIQYTWSMHRI